MVVRKEKKSRKMRGSRTHGYGRVGQHRKAGSRGGRGAYININGLGSLNTILTGSANTASRTLTQQ
jgi:hypothetical protein